jgi:hypothetical protein
LPGPGGRRELDVAIGEIASTPLDRSHPLWEMYFVEGFIEIRSAAGLSDELTAVETAMPR